MYKVDAKGFITVWSPVTITTGLKTLPVSQRAYVFTYSLFTHILF